MEDPEVVLCSTPRLYGLVHNGEWLVQTRLSAYGKKRIRRYYRHIYCTLGQAKSAAQKIVDRYNITADIKEIITDHADIV